MTNYQALVNDARDHIEHIAKGVPGAQADRIRRGENDDPRSSLIVHLANAVEELLAQDQRRVNQVRWLQKNIRGLQHRAKNAEAARDSLQTQVDALTVEWGTLYEATRDEEWIDAADSEAQARAAVAASPTDTSLRKRQVTEWVVAE